MKLEYQVITSTMPEFEQMVEQAISRGWRPCGGVTTSTFPGAIAPYFAQALTRQAVDDKVADELLQWMRTSAMGKWLHCTEDERLYDILDSLATRGDLKKEKLGDRWVFEVQKGEFSKNLADS